MTGDAREVEAYLAAQPEPQRGTLERTRATLRSILPHATEALRYGVPAFVVPGDKAVAGYAGYASHCSYLPMSAEVLVAAGDAVAAYVTSKGALRFAVDAPLPTALVRRLVRLRLAELSAVTDGRRFDHRADGTLRAEGCMRHGLLHGRWRWYRADGTLLRSGSFVDGEQAGEWRTYDRDGGVVKTTRH